MFGRRGLFFVRGLECRIQSVVAAINSQFGVAIFGGKPLAVTIRRFALRYQIDRVGDRVIEAGVVISVEACLGESRHIAAEEDARRQKSYRKHTGSGKMSSQKRLRPGSQPRKADRSAHSKGY